MARSVLYHCSIHTFGFLSSSRDPGRRRPAQDRRTGPSVQPGLPRTAAGVSPKAEVLEVVLDGETLCCRPTSWRTWNPQGMHTMVAATSASISGTNGDVVGTHHVHRLGQQGFATTS